MHKNYLNLFNASTSIKYKLPRRSKVNIEIYDILGRKVSELYNGVQNTGHHEVIWNADKIASGVYFYKLETGRFTDIKRMVLLK